MAKKKKLKMIKLCNWTLKGQLLEKTNQHVASVVMEDEFLFFFFFNTVFQMQPRISLNYLNGGLPNECLEIGNQHKSTSAVINS